MNEVSLQSAAQIRSKKWLAVAKVVVVLFIIASLAVYFVGFSQLPIAHDTFHEVRHSIGLPCH